MKGNQITYTTIDNKEISIPETSSFFNSENELEIISNVYVEDIGTITFSSPVTKFSDYCFKDCQTLTTITLPSTLIEIGNEPFSGCLNMVSVSVENGNSVFSSFGGVLFNRNGTELIYYPVKKGKYTPARTIYGEGTILSENSFLYIKTIDSEEIDESATKVSSVSNSTEPIQIPASYSYETEYTVPDGVNTLKERSFFKSSNLKKVTLSKDINKIEDETFKDCSVLVDVRACPSRPPILGNDVFGTNAQNRKIYIRAKNITRYRFDSSWDDYDRDLVPVNTIFRYFEPNYMLSESDSYIDSSGKWHLSRVLTGKLENGILYLSDY